MANNYPCPNPTCKHVFPLHSIKGAATLTCPRCGTTFQFRQHSTAAAKSYPVAAKAPVPPPAPKTAPPPVASPLLRTETMAKVPTEQHAVLTPAAAPVAPRAAVPLPAPIQAVPPAAIPAAPRSATAPPPAVAAPPALWKPWEWWKIVAVVLAALGLLEGMVAAIVVLVRRPASSAAGISGEKTASSSQRTDPKVDWHVYRHPLGIYEFTNPLKDWHRDEAVEKKFPVDIALGRVGPTSGAAILNERYTRDPSDDELADLTLGQLKNYFREVKKADRADVKLANRAARRLIFFGNDDATGTLYRIECDTLVVREGVDTAPYWHVYWFVTWSTPDDRPKLTEDWEKLRAGFKLLTK